MTRLVSRLFCVILFGFGIGLAMQIDLPRAQSQEPGRKASMVLPLDIAPLLGQSFSEITAIVAFLESLNGEIPEVSPPRLP
jgi:hypothetical protein